MRKTISLLVLLIMVFCFSSAVSAAEKAPTILAILTGSLHKKDFWDKNLYKKTTQNLQNTFEPYNLLIGDQYKKILEDNGTPAAGSMERSDLISLFKELNPDYIIVYEFMPYYNGVGGVLGASSSTAVVHLKVIDTARNKYISNKQFTYRSTWASIDGRYSEIYKNIENEIFSKHFPLAKIAVKTEDMPCEK